MIPVVFIADSNYVLPTTVVMASMLLNKNQKTEYEFIIFGVNLKEKDKLLLNKAAKGAKISILEFDNKKYSSFVAKTHVSVAALYKFDIANILQNYDKVLYLDGDIIVQDDLSEFFNMDLSKNYVAAVKDAYVLCEKKDALEIDGYFNSGVMLLNCEQMRKDNMAEKLLEIKTKTPNMLFMDQDVLNIAFKDRVVYADFRYNFAASYFRPQYRKHLMKISGKDMAYVKAIRPAIIHYTGKNPWQYYHRIKANIWRKYFKKSVVADVKLDYKDSWKGKIKKLFSFSFIIKKSLKSLFFVQKIGNKRIVSILGVNFSYDKKKNSKLEKILPKDYPLYLCKWYKKNTGHKLDLKRTKTFNEKMQWLKLYDATDLKTRLADKYLVRDWIKEKIGNKYLIPLLGVYDTFDDIDFEALPNQFVLKCTHGSGYNIIVDDKSQFDVENAKIRINAWMSENYAFKSGFEMHYLPIPKKIIVEEYINPKLSNVEIQLWCFHNELKFISYETCKSSRTPCRAIFTPEWEEEKFMISPQKYSKFLTLPSKPPYLDELKNLVSKLCRGFIHVRVDFIVVNNELKFREMTFTSGSGISRIEPENYALVLGEMIKLP